MKIKRIFFVVLAAATFGAAVALSPGAAPPELELISGGRSDYDIVLPENADRVEEYAAWELRDFLERMGDVKLPIVRESGGSPGVAGARPGRQPSSPCRGG